MLDWTTTQEVSIMPRKRYAPEELIQHLRTVELETGKGLPVLDACRKLGITKQTGRTSIHGERGRYDDRPNHRFPKGRGEILAV